MCIFWGTTHALSIGSFVRRLDEGVRCSPDTGIHVRHSCVVCRRIEPGLARYLHLLRLVKEVVMDASMLGAAVLQAGIGGFLWFIIVIVIIIVVLGALMGRGRFL